MTLYEMTEQARELYALLESGEIDDQTFADTLDAIGSEEKTNSYCKIIRQLQADAEALKAEIDRLTAKKKAAEVAVERMKAALLDFALASGGKVRTELFSVGTRTTQSADIINPDAIPAAYRIAQPDKISKAEILKALKAGESIPGAKLSDNISVTIK